MQLAISTDWVPGELPPGHGLSPDGSRRGRNLHGWGMGYHTRHPQYDGHEPDGHCGLLGGECYYNQHLSGADPVIPQFLERGEQAVWDVLEAAYERTEAERQAEAAGDGEVPGER